RLSAGRAAVVPYSFRGLVRDAVCGSDLVPLGSERYRTPAVVAGREHAASAARVFLAGHAAHAFVWGVHVISQHARGDAALQCDQSVALYDRYLTAGVPGR